MSVRHVDDPSWPAYEESLKTCDAALVAVGSVETHGPHLSLCADSLVGDALVERAVERINHDVLLLPTIPYAIVLQHGMERNPSYPGIIGARDDTLRALLTDIAACLARDGIRKLILLNLHGGNA